MKDKSFWLQLAVSFIVGGGGTGILVHFREQLPLFAYSTLLYIIWIFFVVLIVRLLFGDKIYNWFKEWQKHRLRVKTARELLAKWMNLEELISELVRNGWQWNKQHQDKYSALHFWFNSNRVKFLPLWKLFLENRPYAAHAGSYSSASLYQQVFHGNYEDFFSYFYKPRTVEMLKKRLQNRDTELPNVLDELTEHTLEFLEWVKLR